MPRHLGRSPGSWQHDKWNDKAPAPVASHPLCCVLDSLGQHAIVSPNSMGNSSGGNTKVSFFFEMFRPVRTR